MTPKQIEPKHHGGATLLKVARAGVYERSSHGDPIDKGIDRGNIGHNADPTRPIPPQPHPR